MCKKAYIYVNYKNIVVLKNYLDIVKQALEKNNYECEYVKKINGLDKKVLYVFPMGIDAFKFYFKGYRNFIIWMQGATADESFLRNHSMIRYKLLNFIDCFALKKAKFILFCSNYMKMHYERLSKTSFENKSYIMPCYNESINLGIIYNKDYNKKIFTYVGSLDLWQCFDETVRLYKKIETIYPDAQLKVLTFSVDEAIKKLKENHVKNYTVKCVKKEEVQKELQDVVYGFLIRDDSIVNRVATPTKLSSYMSVGIIPIFSTVLDDFYNQSKKMKYTVPIRDVNNINGIKSELDKNIVKKELLNEYIELFETYYGTKRHISKISECIQEENYEKFRN